jgi:hypothetical protein
MREIVGRCRITLPYMGEFKGTNWAAMSKMALCHFIQLIPRLTYIP